MSTRKGYLNRTVYCVGDTKLRDRVARIARRNAILHEPWPGGAMAGYSSLSVREPKHRREISAA